MKQLRRILLLAAVALLLVATALAVDIWTAGERSDPGPADIALVLGAAVANGKPTPVFAERLRHAANLYRAGTVKQIMVSGGVGAGDTVSEAEAGRALLVAEAVPEDAILLETAAQTTWQNFVNSVPILAANGARTVLVVSDPLHMRRAMQMATEVGLDARPSPTPTSRYQSLGTQLPMLLREMYFLLHHWVTGA